MNPDALRELDFTYPGLGMPIGGCPRLGLPVTICSDGSYGLKRYMPMADGKYYTTVFPSPFNNASTWNTHLLQQLSAAYAREGREAGVQVLLGPGMNIMRDPLCGRNFEYYSEDPCSRVAWEPQWSVAYRAKDWQRPEAFCGQFARDRSRSKRLSCIRTRFARNLPQGFRENDPAGSPCLCDDLLQ